MLIHHPTVIVYRLPWGEVRIINVHSHRHTRQVKKMTALHSACLRDIARLTGKGDSTAEKQEAPEVAASEASTAHLPLAPEVRAASAQSDTRV